MRLQFHVSAVWVVAAALLIGAIASSLMMPHAASAQEPGYALALDADPENGSGPCNPVDESVEVDSGNEFSVAICVIDAPDVVSAFQIKVEYDGGLMEVPEGDDSIGGLDENPDANAGDTSFPPTSLGDGWDCTAFTVAPPTGDVVETPDVFDARLTCNYAITENPDARLSGTGPLGIIRLNAVAEGPGRLDFSADSGVGLNLTTSQLGLCADAGGAELIECRSAFVSIGVGEGTPVPTRTVSAPTEEARATQTAVTAARETVAAGGGTPVPGDGTPGVGDGTPGPGDGTPDGDDATPASGTRTRTPPSGIAGQGASGDDDDDGGMSTALIITIVVAAVAVVGAGGGYAYWRMRMRGRA